MPLAERGNVLKLETPLPTIERHSSPGAIPSSGSFLSSRNFRTFERSPDGCLFALSFAFCPRRVRPPPSNALPPPASVRT